MSQFVRLIDHSIIDFFVQKAEDLSYCRDQFLKDTPYLLCDGDLYGLSGNLPEEPADSLVVAETFGNGEDVVLQTAQSRGCNLGRETGALTFAEAKVGLTILEHDFKRPASGVCLPGLEEVDVSVGGKQSVPFSMLSPANRKDPYRDASESRVKHDIVAFEPAAVLLELEFLAKLHKCGSGEVSMFCLVFCLAVLADLYHAEPVTPDAAGVDEPDDVLVGEPAVRQDITELYSIAYGPLYHLLGKFELGHAVCLLAIAEYLAVMLGPVTTLKFFGAHAIIPVLSLFSDYVEVKENLRHAVCHGHAEAFESEDGLMRQMGVDPSDFLDCATCLLMVGVVENQTDILGLMVGTKAYLPPQLHGYAPQCLAPVHCRILHKAEENILLSRYQRFKRAVLLVAPGIADAETWEQQQTLEDGQQTIHAVAFAGDTKRAALSHSDPGEKVTYVLHGCCHVRIFEKCFDIREKRSNFVYRHGLEYVFLVVLKITQFLPIRQETMSFFYAFISGISYLRNLNHLYHFQIFLDMIYSLA